jgi:hypothetical protein
MYRLWSAALALFFLALTALAHVTPNVTLIRRGDFVKQALPGATKFFEKTLGSTAVAAVREATGWTPTQEEAKVYVGREESGRLVGSVVFLWVPSEHGPVGLGVAFGPDGQILEATVTDVGTEPLVWVRPLLLEGRLHGINGIGYSQRPDPVRIAAGASGQMSRYYARVIAGGVARAQALERVLARAGKE